jgi:hypothetical protein
LSRGGHLCSIQGGGDGSILLLKPIVIVSALQATDKLLLAAFASRMLTVDTLGLSNDTLLTSRLEELSEELRK